MSKYGELIKQARATEDKNTSKPNSQKTKQPENQINVTDDAQETPEPEPEPAVNLCVKVPVSLRRHWSAEAKRQGTTMTAVIIEALNAKFGRPD